LKLKNYTYCFSIYLISRKHASVGLTDITAAVVIIQRVATTGQMAALRQRGTLAETT